MAAAATALEYSKTLTEVEESLRAARSGEAAARLMIVALVLAVAFLAVSRRSVPAWYPALSLPLAAMFLRTYLRRRKEAVRYSRLAAWYRLGVARVCGEWPGNGAAGHEFRDSTHVFSGDLNLFGEGSLFEYLCTTRTEMGRRRLAEWLLQAPAVPEMLARQEAIQELAGRTTLREMIALLGRYEFEGARWATFAEWMEAPPVVVHAWPRVLALATSTLLALLVLAGFDQVVPWRPLLPWMAPLVAFHAVYGLVRRQTQAAMQSLGAVSPELGVLRQGLALMARQSFRSPLLVGLTERVAASGAAGRVHQLERLARALEQRGKDWFYLPSLALMFATQICMAVEDWRRANRAGLAEWLNAWADFDALNALAGYAYENPESTYPQFTEGGVEFQAEGLGHPLLGADECVRNDVRLDGAARFYIVSGSNMAGKSTLLRAIGVNAVLAQAGAPVRARRMRLSPVAICASIAVGDSLLQGKSKFLAEVERVRHALELARGPRPVLFVIDEIFSGTNSRDRRAVAETVMRELLANGAIGAISTHDLALTELPGRNVHMGCRAGGGPLDFDYLLKAGVTQETNARAIASMMGIGPA